MPLTDVILQINTNRAINTGGGVLSTGGINNYTSISGNFVTGTGILNSTFNHLDTRFDDKDFYKKGRFTSFTATFITSSSIQLDWSANFRNPSFMGYEIQRSTDNTIWSTVFNLGTGNITQIDSSLLGERNYYYQIRSTGINNYHSTWKQASATTLTAISGFSILSTTASSIYLTWLDISTVNLGYQLDKSLDGSSWNNIYNLNGAATGQLVTGLNAETLNYFRIRATGLNNGSFYYTNGYTYSAISGFTVAGNSTSGISLTWQDVSNTNTGYVIDRSGINGSTWTNVINNLVATGNSYVDYGLTIDTAYAYRIKATGVLTNSDYYYGADYTYGVSSGNYLASTFIHDSGNGGTRPWITASGASISDNVYASSEYTGTTQTTYMLKGNNALANSQVPTGVAIKGIILNVEYNVINGTSIYMTENTCKLAINGTPSGNNQSGGFSTLDGSDHIAVYGTQNDLWGLSSVLTDTVVNATGFGVAIALNNYAGL